MIYKNFTIENFKGIENVTINLIKDDLVLLLGLNESGKTTILKAIETFDYLNDAEDDPNNTFFKAIRNKADVNSSSPAKITASIELTNDLILTWFDSDLIKSLGPQKLLFEEFLKELNKNKKIIISRVIPFKNGNPQQYYYEFISEHSFTKNRISRDFAKDIVKKCPYIIYFEDFKDRIPEKIIASKSNENYNADWYDIIDGLFYNTNKNYSIEEFKKFYSKKNPRLNDAQTVLKRVNKTLNESFSKKWKKLSGVKDIEETELTYIPTKHYFVISITDTDGTTFNVDERSKGALWYLSFLMKTEFRRKKLRLNSGKPIFLIDEPASNLHSTAQENMIGDFKKLVEDTSVIYSTHSQYLISIDNIKTTYIIERNGGQVSSTLWSDYIKKKTSKESYYQPLANLLNIIPNSFDIPWKKAIITEGPSDLKVLLVMYEILYSKIRDFTIYPGTSAQNLSPLISLNIGWGADFKVLLDSDKEGKLAQKRYFEEFHLDNSTIKILPIDNKKIEGYFTEEEKEKLYFLALNVEKKKISKKDFATVFSILNSTKEKKKKVKQLLSEQTITNFKTLFNELV